MKSFIGTLSLCLTLVMAYLPATNVSSPLIIQDDNSNMIAVWLQELPSSTIYVVQAAAYTSGSWGTPYTISSMSYDAVSPTLAVDENGNCSCVWQVKSAPAAALSLWGAQFTTTTDLSTVSGSLISQTGINVSSYSLSQVLSDETTSATAVYIGYSNTGVYNVYTVTGNGSTWTSPTLLSTTTPAALELQPKKGQQKLAQPKQGQVKKGQPAVKAPFGVKNLK
jgi:hypothetical protein